MDSLGFWVLQLPCQSVVDLAGHDLAKSLATFASDVKLMVRLDANSAMRSETDMSASVGTDLIVSVFMLVR